MQSQAIVKRMVVAVGIALLVVAGNAARAQDMPKGALTDLVQRLVKSGGSKPERGTPAAARFKPSGKRLFLEDTVNSLGRTDEQRDALRQSFTKGAAALEDVLQKEGRANDVSAALTLFLATQWSIATNKEVPDAASNTLLAQTDALFAAPESAKISDADKQRFYEYCLYMTAFTSVTKETAPDADALKGVRSVAARLFETLLTVEPAKVTITAKGLAVIGASAPATPPTSGLASNALALGNTTGWVKKAEQGGITYTRSVATDRGGLSVSVLFLTAGAVKGTPETVANSLFDKIVRPQIPAPGLPADLRPEVFRRYIGNDLRCSFLDISRNIKQDSQDYLGTTQEMHLYAVESGGMVIPVMVLMGGHDGTGAGGKLIKSSVRGEWLEELLKGITGTPSGKPLYSNAELAGDYQMSAATTGLQYYNINTGASAGYAFVVHGSKLSLRADGTFDIMNYGANGIGGPANFQIQKGKGRYQLVKDGGSVLLKMTDAATGKSFDERLAGAMTLPGTAGKLVVMVPIGTSVNATNVALSAARYLTNSSER